MDTESDMREDDMGMRRGRKTTRKHLPLRKPFMMRSAEPEPLRPEVAGRRERSRKE